MTERNREHSLHHRCEIDWRWLNAPPPWLLRYLHLRVQHPVSPGRNVLSIRLGQFPCSKEWMAYTHASGYHNSLARNENGQMVAPAVSFQLLSSHNTACTSPRCRKDTENYVQSCPWFLVSFSCPRTLAQSSLSNGRPRRSVRHLSFCVPASLNRLGSKLSKFLLFV